VVFAAIAALFFIVLTIMNLTKGPNRRLIAKSVNQIEIISHLLAKEPIDWDEVDDAYNGSLVKFVRETDRFLERARLHDKITTAIANGQKKYLESFSPILIHDTLFRFCLLHIEALLNPQDDLEARLSIEQRSERIDLLAHSIDRYLADSSKENAEEYRQWFSASLKEWQQNPDREAGQCVVERIDLIMADIIIAQIGKWRQLNVEADAQRLEALLLQLHINQLYYILYERLFERIGETTRQLLMELDNDPREIDMDAIENTIRQEYEDRLKGIRSIKG